MSVSAAPAPFPVAVVTGAASGLGREFVLLLAERGWRCVAADVDEAGLAGTLGAAGSAAVRPQRTDVCDPAAMQALADSVFRQEQRLDLLVNNAAILDTGRCWEMPLERWRRILDVNLMGVVNALHAFVPRFIAQGHGQVLNIASAAALSAHAHVAAYTAAKHGVLALSECLGRELAELGSAVQVSVAFPGAIDTGIARSLRARPAAERLPIDELLGDLAARGEPPRLVARAIVDALPTGAFALFPQPRVADQAWRRIERLLPPRQTPG